MNEPRLQAQERSAAYQYFADAFRYPPSNNGEEQRQLDYVASFDCSVYQSACSLHEAAYASEGQEVLFEELTRFYEYFGLERDRAADLPDHLTVELEFMHFLSFLEAGNTADDNAMVSLRRAQRDFLNRHLQKLVLNIAENYPGNSLHYKSLLDELLAFINAEYSYLNEC